jgi:hypothetical protein
MPKISIDMTAQGTVIDRVLCGQQRRDKDGPVRFAEI